VWLDDDAPTATERISSLFRRDATQSAESVSKSAPSRVRRYWKPVAAVLVALLVGIGIGAASNSDASKVKSLNAQLDTAHQTIQSNNDALNGDQSQIADLKTHVSSAQSDAANADKNAEAKAQSDYAAKLATVQDQENKVKSREDAVSKREAAVQQAEQGLRATAFDGDGVYLVGRDIQPGTYSSPGPSGDQCYWARESSPNDSDIIDNHLGAGPTVVQVLPSDVALRVDGCQPFKKIG
jgi:hypothetical protein